jgi:hypothetical protein
VRIAVPIVTTTKLSIVIKTKAGVTAALERRFVAKTCPMSLGDQPVAE